MGGIPLGLLVEGSVAILLILTIGYCVILNNKLNRLHADRDALKQMVADLLHATNLAQSAIGGLREAATEAESTLDARLSDAERFAVELANHVNSGQAVMERIARITDAASRSETLEPKVEQRGAHAALQRLAAHQKNRENAA